MARKIGGKLPRGVLRNRGESDAGIAINAAFQDAHQRIVELAVQAAKAACVARLLQFGDAMKNCVH